MRERGAGDLLETAIDGISSRSNRAVVAFGEAMIRPGVAAGYIRAHDANELRACSGGDARMMVLLTTGLLATAFANVVPWRGSTRARPVYAVYHRGADTTFGGWVPTALEEIAAVYVTTAITALDELHDSGRVDDSWRERHPRAWFASQIGDSSAHIVSALEWALAKRWFLAGNGARLQELDPAKDLPVGRAKALLYPEDDDGPVSDEGDGGGGGGGDVDGGIDGDVADHPSEVGVAGVAGVAGVTGMADGRAPGSSSTIGAIVAFAENGECRHIGDADGSDDKVGVVGLWTSNSEAHGVGRASDAWGADVPFTETPGPTHTGETIADALMTVPVDPPIAVTASHLRSMDLFGDADDPRPRGCGVFVKLSDGGKWGLQTHPSRGDVYVEDVHALVSVPWPGADTIAAFSASVYGPSGQLWEAVAIVVPDNSSVEGPHARAQIGELYPHIRRLPFRPPRRREHKVLRTLPRITAPIIETGASVDRVHAVLSRMSELAVSVANTTAARPRTLTIGEPVPISAIASAGTLCGSGSSLGGGSARNRVYSDDGAIVALGAHMDDVEIVRHELGAASVAENGHREYVYVTTDGFRVTLPSGGWGAHGAESTSGTLAGASSARIRSRVREYWASVPFDSLNEFLECPLTVRGRMTPHDAPKRLVRPRVFVMATDERARHITFRETALGRVSASLAWDRDARLVDERGECFVYLLTNMIDPRFPLVVVAGLVLGPFLPSSVQELIALEWRSRGEMCPHVARCDTEYHDEDGPEVDAYMRVANEMPANEDGLVDWLSALMSGDRGASRA
jgi:hypothetical protein